MNDKRRGFTPLSTMVHDTTLFTVAIEVTGLKPRARDPLFANLTHATGL